MSTYLKICLIMASLLSSPMHAQTLLNLLPDNPKGWKALQADRVYNSEDLYEYINGGAELYLSYGMSEVASRIITKKEMEIRIEIFDMTSSENAFGVFSHTRTSDEKRFGQGSQYFTGALIFWKANYYISITANDENEMLIGLINSLAAEIDQNITKVGLMPALIELLPSENALVDGYVYFNHYIWLNSYYFISNDNLLGINAKTDAVLAKYGNSDNRYYLLMVYYPDASSAETAYQNLQGKLFENQGNIIMIEDKGWIAAQMHGSYLVAVFNAPSEIVASGLLGKALEKIKIGQP